jgi:von Willebrand factor type A domain
VLPRKRSPFVGGQVRSTCAVLPLILTFVVPAAAQLTDDKALWIHRTDLSDSSMSVVFLSALQVNWRASQEPIMGITPLALAAGAFEVYLDRQPVKDLRVQRFAESPFGIDVVLAIDISGSVHSDFVIQDAVKAYLARLRVGKDQAAILTFGTDSQSAEFRSADGRYSPFTDSIADLQRATAAPVDPARKAKTVLYKAVADAIDKAQIGRLNRTATTEKVVIVLSDGHDESQGYDISVPIGAAKKSQIPVFTLGLPEPATHNGFHDVLDRIAKESGAVFVPIKDENQLKAVYEKLDSLLKSQYVLTFQVPPEFQDGRDHVLNVLASNGSSSLSAKLNVATEIRRLKTTTTTPTTQPVATTKDVPKSPSERPSRRAGWLWWIGGGFLALVLLVLVAAGARRWALRRREKEDDDGAQ